MLGKFGRRMGLGLLALLLVFAVVQWAAAINPNERTVKPEPNVQDADDIRSPDSKIWVLDFKFKDPRLIKVNMPGRGQKVHLPAAEMRKEILRLAESMRVRSEE